MPICNICFTKVRTVNIVPKDCCVYDICYKCYLQYDKHNCMFCKRKIGHNNMEITPRLFFKSVLLLNIPRCLCIVKSGNRRGLSCLNNIYPPFKTCIGHLENKPKNYQEYSKNSLKYIIYGIKFTYSIEMYLGTFYLFNKYYVDNNDNNDNEVNYETNRLHFRDHQMLPLMCQQNDIKNIIYEETKDSIIPFENINNLNY